MSGEFTIQGSITVNGKKINIPHGRSVSVVNGVVSIDGRLYTDEPEPGKPLSIEIDWKGPVADLTIEGNNTKISCQDVSGSIKASGSVEANAVGKNVKAQGSVTCGDVAGDVDAMGSITCDKVGGNVKAMGSVRHR